MEKIFKVQLPFSYFGDQKDRYRIIKDYYNAIRGKENTKDLFQYLPSYLLESIPSFIHYLKEDPNITLLKVTFPSVKSEYVTFTFIHKF